MTSLIFAPHPDDEVLGVGGTIAKLSAKGMSIVVCVVARGKAPLFNEEETMHCTQEMKKAHNVLGNIILEDLSFPSCQLDTIPQYELNNAILDIIRKYKPDSVFIPHYGDIHKDHRIVAESALVALRPKYEFQVGEILMYETLSETGWNNPASFNAFLPTVYCDITKYINLKIKAFSCFTSQIQQYPQTRSIESIKALAAYRGTTVQVNYAEAFQLVRRIL